ncbi:iron chelate uptake ABC transporter family permease subunit [Leifsonia lichenia]
MLCSVLVVLVSAAYLFLFIRGGFAFAVERRATVLGAIVVVAFAQGVATVLFHTATDNRILTPSIMGLDALYVLMQTSLAFVFGGEALARTDGLPRILVQSALMVTFAVVLFRWLFGGRFANLPLLLLVGIVLGMAFESVSSFLQRMLAPADFDKLETRLFGQLSSVSPAHLPVAFVVCAAVGVVVWLRRRRLDVLLLGRDLATGLGMNHRRELTGILVAVAVLTAFSTALVGPMTFFGFLVALLAYQFTGSHEHRFVLPMTVLIGILALVSAQFVLQHLFRTAGYVTLVLEFVGGTLFLVMLLKKGRL